MVRQTALSSCCDLGKVLTVTDQFPGPTIEARSGDILEIEVFNLAEESVSLHWHGLHMRGS
jgi:FtsP/CotA-like multicopper oxidase with cupredoxin domain